MTPLPCNIKHYFHHDCIEQWMKTNNVCPLCRKEINRDELNKFNKELDELLAVEEQRVAD